MKAYCQDEGVRRAQARWAKSVQLRATLSSEERLLQLNPSFVFLKTAHDIASQGLTEQELQQAEWQAIRSSTRWKQLDGQMKKDFFLSVQKANSAPPIQLLRSEDGWKYDTNGSVTAYATAYYQEPITTQGSSLSAQNHYWNKVPKLVSAEMNQALKTPLAKAKVY